MKLLIVTTEKIIDYEVNWVELNTPVGNMVIQKEHVPMVVELSSQKELLFELESGQKKSIEISQAVAHITRSEVKILIPIKI